MQNTTRFLPLSFAFAILFSLLICWHPSLGPIDDRILFLPFNIFQCSGNGRFYILDGIEQLSLNHFFGLSPFLFYLVNSIEFLILFWVLYRITKKTWIPVLAALTPGLCTAYLRLFVPERLLVLCFSILVLFDQKTQKNRLEKVIYIVAALASFLLKEPAFLVVGGLSFFRFLQKKDRSFHAGMMGLSAAYGVFLYSITRIVFSPDASYSVGNHMDVSSLIKNLMNYALNDPAVVLLSIPLWFMIWVRTRRVDPYLTLVIGYFSVFMALGLYQEYYLLPLLPFILVILLQYWPTLPRFIRGTFAILFISSFLSGIGQISNYKNIPKDFYETISSLPTELMTSETRICYLGLHADQSREIISSSESFFAHLHPNQAQPAFVGIQSEKDIPSCHFLIDTPYNFDSLTAPVNWPLVLQFKPWVSIPNFSLRSWIKWISLKWGQTQMVDKNIFRKQGFTTFVRP